MILCGALKQPVVLMFFYLTLKKTRSFVLFINGTRQRQPIPSTKAIKSSQFPLFGETPDKLYLA